MTREQFKAARLTLGFTQAGLAEQWGMGSKCGRTIRRWESGDLPLNSIAAHCIGLMVNNAETTISKKRRNTMKYIVVLDIASEAFCQEVDGKLRDGWVCQGGVSVVATSNNTKYKYTQAMIFYG